MIPLQGTFIYFVKPIGLDGPIKIGCSRSPPTRLSTLATWSPWPLEIIGTVPGGAADEKFVHQCFADLYSHREWFRSTPELRSAIAAILAAGSVDVIRGSHAPKGKIVFARRDRRPLTEIERRYYSYIQRMEWAERRLRTSLGPRGAWHAPSDVHKIISNWRQDRQTPPTSADIERLNEYLADPATHAVAPDWAQGAPKLVAV